jgi:hypothetical protein
MARSIRLSGARLKVAGMAMPGSGLPRRIGRILTHGPAPRLTRARALCLALALTAVSAVFAAASVERNPSDPPPPPAPSAAPAPAATPQSTPIPAATPQLQPTPTPVPTPQPTPELQSDDLEDKRLIVMFFDLSATPEAAGQALAFVRNRLQPNDRVAIISADDRVKLAENRARLVEYFTGDRDRLIRDIQGLPFTGDAGFDSGSTFTGFLGPIPLAGALHPKSIMLYVTANVPSTTLVKSFHTVVSAIFDIQPVLSRLTAAEYVLGPENVVSIAFASNSALDCEARVRPDGSIEVPGIGSVMAAGLTVSQLQESIAHRALAVMQAPQVLVKLTGVYDTHGGH